MIASQKGDAEIASLLLKSGAESNTKENEVFRIINCLFYLIFFYLEWGNSFDACFSTWPQRISLFVVTKWSWYQHHKQGISSHQLFVSSSHWISGWMDSFNFCFVQRSHRGCFIVVEEWSRCQYTIQSISNHQLLLPLIVLYCFVLFLNFRKDPLLWWFLLKKVTQK